MVIGHLWVFTWIVVQVHNPLYTYSMGMYCPIRQTLESQFNMTQTTTSQYPFLWISKRTASWVNNYSILQLRNWKVISCILCISKCSFNFQWWPSSIYQAYVFLPKRLHGKHCMEVLFTLRAFWLFQKFRRWLEKARRFVICRFKSLQRSFLPALCNRIITKHSTQWRSARQIARKLQT